MAKKLSDILKDILKKQSLDEVNKSNRDKAYDLRKIYEEMELSLISSMKRAFYYHKREEENEGFQWEQWQRAKLRGLEKFRKENKKIIGSYSRVIEKTIKDSINDNYKSGQGRVASLIERIRKFFNPEASLNLPEDISEKQATRDYIARVLNRPVRPPDDESFFAANEKKLKALHETVNNDMIKANNSVLRKMDAVYRQTIFKTELYMTSGVKSLNKAIDMATKEFLNSGINSIIYKDGKRVNIASYAEMALRTASHRATLLGEGSKRDEYGIHTVVVTAHANTCKHCLPWQGKVLIDDVFSHGTSEDGDYPMLSEAIEKGFMHPNCRHTLATYFPGITNIPKIPDNESSLSTYAAEQTQRYMERQIRKWKRVRAGSVDSENWNKANNKVKEWEDNLKQHLYKNNQLRREYNREINKIPIEENGNDDILSSKKWFKAPFSTEKRFNTHIKKHLVEYGDITPEQYLNIARDLLAAPLSDDIEGFISNQGWVFKYRKSTNDFVMGHPKGTISTLFKPKEKYDYFLGEKEKYK